MLSYIVIIFQSTYFQIQMHHIVSMQKGHSNQDLLGQSDHIFLCEGVVVISNTLVEDFTTSGTGRKAQEGKLRKQNKDKMWRKPQYMYSHPVEFSLAYLSFWLFI